MNIDNIYSEVSTIKNTKVYKTRIFDTFIKIFSGILYFENTQNTFFFLQKKFSSLDNIGNWQNVVSFLYEDSQVNE